MAEGEEEEASLNSKLMTNAIAAVLAIIIGTLLIENAVRHRYHKPQVGDVYVSYEDRRGDQWALTNGFCAEAICVYKVTAVSNDVVFTADLSLPITNTGQYPFPYNQFGPASNFRTYKEYRTLVKPSPRH